MADPILGEQQFVPNRLVTSNRTRFYRDTASGALSVQYSKDGGKTWNQFISEPSSIATEGWIPTLTLSGGVEWRPILSVISSASTTSAVSRSWADFMFPGSLYPDKAFGYFKVPSGQTMECYGAQFSVFTPATSSGIVLRLAKLQGSSLTMVGQEMVLAKDSLMATTIFDPVVMPSGSEWRMILTSVGSQDPGEFLSCRILMNVLE